MFSVATGLLMYCECVYALSVYRCSNRSQMLTSIMFNLPVRTQEDIIMLIFSSWVSKTYSRIDPSIPTMSPLRAHCQSSQPSSGGQPHGQYDFAQKTETWASPWKEIRQSRWFRWTLSAQLLWVNLHSIPLAEQGKIYLVFCSQPAGTDLKCSWNR